MNSNTRSIGERSYKKIYIVVRIFYYDNMSFDRKTYMRKYMKKWYQEHKEEENRKSREYHRLHKEECNKNTREHYHNHKEEYQAHNKRWIQEHPGYNKKKSRIAKIKALETIAKHHNMKIECWRCHEKQLWVLTIGHPNKDGKEDKKIYGISGVAWYGSIISGEKTCDNLKIECMNCNSCLEWYGKYPDEMIEKDFQSGE